MASSLAKVVRLHSPAPPGEVLRRARALTQPVGLAPSGPWAAGRRRACDGEVGADGFALRRLDGRGRPGSLLMLGRIEPDRGGTAIQIRFRPARAALATAVVLSVAAAVVGLRLRDQPGPATTAELALLCGAALGAAVVILRLAWEQARLLRLADYLTGALTAHGLAAMLAERE